MFPRPARHREHSQHGPAQDGADAVDEPHDDHGMAGFYPFAQRILRGALLFLRLRID